ncbi:MAG TPA: Lrp/AsnC family transcriptional regulator [Gemmatimonadales bacterium]|jgi:Lrp/AsnC family leucine-responsive transcriptional regulator
MDAVDTKIIALLLQDGREAWARIGDRVGLTGPAVAERVRRLEESGVIRGYAALVAPGPAGFPLTAFVSVTLETPHHRRAFLARVASLHEVQECHHVTGDDDYLLKIRSRGPADLDRLLTEQLKGGPGVLRTRTLVVLRSEKESVRFPPLDARE